MKADAGRYHQTWSRHQNVLGLTVFVVLLFILSMLFVGNFATSSNMLTIATNIGALGIVSTGQAIAIFSGNFDLSISGVVPLCAVIYVQLTVHGSPWGWALVLALLSGAIVGVINGLVVTVVRINPLIATLGMLAIATGVAFALSNGLTVQMTKPGPATLGNDLFGAIPTTALVLLAVVVVAALVMRGTLYGRWVYASGGNLEAARLAGIRTGAVTISVYVVSGLTSALAGILISAQLHAASPSFGSDLTLTSVTVVILGGAALTGGIGSMEGTVLGLVILGILGNVLALLFVPSYYQQVLTGLVLLVAVGLGQIRAASGKES